MKIKSDFITNSSSTMYIVYIPDDFYVDEADILQYIFDYEIDFAEYSEEHDMGDISYEEYMLKEVPSAFEDLRNSDIWHYGFDGCAVPLYHIILDILKKHELILESIDCNGEGNNQIVDLRDSKMKKLFMAEALRELKRVEVKGDTDVTEA